MHTRSIMWYQTNGDISDQILTPFMYNKPQCGKMKNSHHTNVVRDEFVTSNITVINDAD